jgi:integrase
MTCSKPLVSRHVRKRNLLKGVRDMASVLNLPNGRRAVQFFAPDGERRTVRFGKLSREAALECARSIDTLIDAKNAGQQAPARVLAWVAELSDEVADRLATLGVIPARHKALAVVLEHFLTEYRQKRTDVKPATAIVYSHTIRCLVEFFGADKPLEEITAGDADEWRLWLADDQGLADNTIRRRCGIAKQFFRAAVRKRLIVENPFAEMKGCGVRENRSREYFITIAEAVAVLDACPDAQWRLLFALSRFGGLRCPSEHFGLRWSDVDWERNRMTIHSPKTEHHVGGESRQIPVFPELRSYLEEVFDQAEPGTEWLITRYRGGINLRTALQKIIRRAGLNPWPKPWQNLRATRETELAETFPIHVVCQWIGNTEAVAKKHYLQTTDEHYLKATEGDCSEWKKALQKAVHQLAISSNNENQQKCGNTVKQAISRVSGGPLLVEGGPEHTPESSGNTGFRPAGAAESNALLADKDSDDSDRDLHRLVDVWPGLEADVRRRILEFAGLE